eukprot:gene6821-7534_t
MKFVFFLFFLFLLRVKAELEKERSRGLLNQNGGHDQVVSRPYRHFANPHNRTFELFDEKFYLANYGKSVIAQNISAYDHWVSKGLHEGKKSHGGLSVVAFIVMTKDDWPLIKHWVLYHGDKFGFKNLYVIDDSSDPRCIDFLHAMRDKKGLTLIETKANLNLLEREMTHLATEDLVFRYDYVIKMDTDEFLVHYDHIKQKISFNNVLDNLSTAIYDGVMQRVNFVSMTVPDRKLCEDPSVRDRGPVFVSPSRSTFVLTTFKAVNPTASLLAIDLGGHRGNFHSDFDNGHVPGASCKRGSPCFRYVPGLSVIHSHFGCPLGEVQNLKKAMLSHGYILLNDTVKQQIAKLAPKSTHSGYSSSHKVRAYYAYITNPSGWKSSYYGTLDFPSINLAQQIKSKALIKSLELRNLVVLLEAKYSDV